MAGTAAELHISYEELERMYNWYTELTRQKKNDVEDDLLAEKIQDAMEEL